MAKVFVCDMCDKTLKDPHEAKMREFLLGVEYDFVCSFPCKVTTRWSKVHLCGTCYEALREVATEKRGDSDA